MAASQGPGAGTCPVTVWFLWEWSRVTSSGQGSRLDVTAEEAGLERTPEGRGGGGGR